MQRWEYKTIATKKSRLARFTRDLNHLGGEGWEAVSVWEMKNSLHPDELGVLLKRRSEPLVPRDPRHHTNELDYLGDLDLKL